MEGLRFVREEHFTLADGCYLPHADLLGFVDEKLHEIVFAHPELKKYIPELLDVDIFVSWDVDKFLMFISPEKRAHLPARGMEFKHLPALREAGTDLLGAVQKSVDITELESSKSSFGQLQFALGFAAAGIFPSGRYDDESKAVKQKTGAEIANLIQKWAVRRKERVENSRIFLSHKGANKPLVAKIDTALRLLNLKTWFDRDDIVAGDTLVRSVDKAFEECAAAVFFISADFVDSGVIRKEIDRAIHEEAMRSGGFRVIPLVLAQHGGHDGLVPGPFRTLAWKTVDDIEIVPAILWALPQMVRDQIEYAAPK